MLDSARHPNPLIGLIDEVSRVHGRIKSAFATVSADAGLAQMDMTVLTAVIEAQLPPTVPQIGRSLGHPRQVIQRAAHALLATGLIETTPNPDHKRAPRLVATGKGKAINDEANRAAAKISAAMLRHINAQAIVEAAVLLRDIRHGIERHAKDDQ